MDPKHIMKMQGKDFVMYEGLLDQAHREGLISITTTLIQVPSEANDHTAICAAVVTLERDGVRRTFGGIGDANPRNTSRNVALHLIRMSETRSKARALRDAINVGMCAFEELETAELGAEEGDPYEGTTGRREPEPLAPIATSPTKAQLDEIERGMKRAALTFSDGKKEMERQFRKSTRAELTGAQAATFIEWLGKLSPAVKVGGAAA